MGENVARPSGLVNFADYQYLMLIEPNSDSARAAANGVTSSDGAVFTTSVVVGIANPFGFVHIGGNVFEMCRDAFAPYSVPPGGPEGLRSETGADIVVRGGSFKAPFSACRVAKRATMNRDQVEEDVGIRPMRRIVRE